MESSSVGIRGEDVGEMVSDTVLALICGEVSSKASNSAASRSEGNSPARDVFSSSAARPAREKVGWASSVARVSWKVLMKRSKSEVGCVS